MDITPPTILIGEKRINRSNQAYKLPFSIDNIGYLFVFFMIE